MAFPQRHLDLHTLYQKTVSLNSKNSKNVVAQWLPLGFGMFNGGVEYCYWLLCYPTFPQMRKKSLEMTDNDYSSGIKKRCLSCAFQDMVLESIVQ